MYNIGSQARMRKLLGKSAVEPPQDHNVGVTSSPITAQAYRPNVSQNAVYTAGSPIKCIDKSPDGQAAILAGPHILKTVKFDGIYIREGLDLRSLITAHTATKNTISSSSSDQLSISDVKWATGQSNRGNATIFTACSNGKIFQYDLTRAGSRGAGGGALEFIQMREDSRQVHTLDINPHRGTLLLSGSQDGIARCFDIRVPIQIKGSLTFRAGPPFKCNAESLRQVKWSPKDGFYFACSTEKGVVLKWDIRKHTAPILKINAHDKICSSIAWHPDGEHLMSAGWDSKCHVWDLSRKPDKRPKPKWTISTPAPASVAVWRPGQWSATAQGKRAAQVAISYDDSNQKRHGINSVHIWDLARPTIPFKEIHRFDSLPSAMLWHDQDLLWTAGQDGLFNQCDVAFSPKVIDRQTISTMAFSAKGDVLMFLDERTQSHRPRLHAVHQDALPTSSLSSSPNAPMLSISRSDSEDEAVANFLGPRRRGGGQKRRLSTRSGQVLSTTPPSAPGIDDHLLPLELAINITGIFRSQQAMAVGHVPAAAHVDVYEYLSVNYLETLHRELPYSDEGRPMVERISSILEHFARAAESVRLFRLAQTWRILAYAMNLLLKRRAQYHREFRMRRLKKPSKKDEQHEKPNMPHIQVPTGLVERDEDTPRKVHSSSSLSKQGQIARSILSEEIESTSNVPTPLARPVRDDRLSAENHLEGLDTNSHKLETIPEPESFALPPALQERPPVHRQRLASIPLSIISYDSESTQSSQAATEGYDFYDTEALTRAIDMPSPKKEPLVLDYVEPGPPRASRAPVLRHDSDDSFSQVFSVSDGSRRSTGLAGSLDESPPKRSKSQTFTEYSVSSESKPSEDVFGHPIAGKQASDPTARIQPAPLRQPLERSETGLTNFTDEHHMITQTTSESLTSRQDEFPTQTDTVFSLGSPETRPYWPEPADSFSEDESPDVVETDYLHWPDDPPYPHPIESDNSFSANLSPPLNPYTILVRALEFEVRSSALNASAMVLLLKPLVPDGVIDSFQAAAILRQHHSRLMSMRLFVEAALLRKLCMRGWPKGKLHGWGEDYHAIFNPAQQGVQVGFFCLNCRKPREIDRTSASTGSIWRCERCTAVVAPCAVCGHRDEAPSFPPTPISPDLVDRPHLSEEEPVMSTWWYCPGCSHGGHSTCLQAWHAPSDCNNMDRACPDSPPEPDDEESQFSNGYCPLDGCGHACLSGRWRIDAAAARTEELSRAVREATRTAAVAAAAAGRMPLTGLGLASGSATSTGGSERRGSPLVDHYGLAVRGDTNEALPSRAVDGAREMLASGSAGREAAGGILSSSPGSRGLGGERERRKSVKFVAQDERR
jgi:WD40 repeat protein